MLFKMSALIVFVGCFTQMAVADQFKDQKAVMLQSSKSSIEDMQQFQKCVEKAKDMPALNTCGQSARTRGEESQKEQEKKYSELQKKYNPNGNGAAAPAPTASPTGK